MKTAVLNNMPAKTHVHCVTKDHYMVIEALTIDGIIASHADGVSKMLG